MVRVPYSKLLVGADFEWKDFEGSTHIGIKASAWRFIEYPGCVHRTVDYIHEGSVFSDPIWIENGITLSEN